MTRLFISQPSLDVEGLYKTWNLSSKRFEWAKINSVILSILHHKVAPKEWFPQLSITAGLIKWYFNSEEAQKNDFKPYDEIVEAFSKAAKALSNGVTTMSSVIIQNFITNLQRQIGVNQLLF